MSTEKAPPSEEELTDRWEEMRAESKGAPDLAKAIRDRLERQLPSGDVPVLTDDYAPTDALLLLYG